jgi:hypothetical protein
MGSELVHLAAAGRIDIQKGRILVLNDAETGGHWPGPRKERERRSGSDIRGAESRTPI